MIFKLSWPFCLMGIMCAGTLASGLFVQHPRCSEILNEGTGQEKNLQFYYNQPLGFCVPFFYKGEGGNNNRFSSDKDCLASCSTGYLKLYPEGDSVCTLKMDHGSCYANIAMYYYDSTEKNCRMFLYGGCQGNGNRFETREECQKMCQAKSGRMLGSAPNPDEQTVDVGLIVGILGGVVFAVAVIATIALLVVQRKRKQTDRKKMPTTDVELS
ncbi:kunitz-type U19-barytoxin-Tl1a [Trichomycterus rosablanca]|uniref:kunitz-type U19-barytoxin-Tl1a n=1 Tax=Trichomycterus rosablanca TaxID=2290929 RepID=UPI002F35D911